MKSVRWRGPALRHFEGDYRTCTQCVSWKTQNINTPLSTYPQRCSRSCSRATRGALLAASEVGKVSPSRHRDRAERAIDRRSGDGASRWLPRR